MEVLVNSVFRGIDEITVFIDNKSYNVDDVFMYKNNIPINIYKKDTVVSYIIYPTANVSDINKVIESAPDYTEIFFTEGRYNINEPINIFRSNINLTGVLGITVFVFNVNADSINIASSLQDGHISNINIRNIMFEGIVSKHFIFVARGNCINIESCQFNGGGDTTIDLRAIGLCGCTKSRVINNNIINVSVGVGVDYDLPESLNSDNIIITSNMISQSSSGIVLYGSTICDINNNSINNMSGAAITISSSNYITISKNNVNNSGHGIYVSNSSFNRIIGNTLKSIRDCILLWTKSTKNLLMGNVVAYSTLRDISIYDGSNDNLLIGNTITNTAAPSMPRQYLFSSGLLEYGTQTTP